MIQTIILYDLDTVCLCCILYISVLTELEKFENYVVDHYGKCDIVNKRQRKPKGNQDWAIQRHWQH